MRVNKFVLDCNIWISYFISANQNLLINAFENFALQTSSGFVTRGDKDVLNEKDNLEKKYTKLKILTKAEFESIFLKTDISETALSIR